MPLFSQSLAGLAMASQLFLLAAGLTLTAGTTRSFNVSHGSLAMLGAYVAWSIAARLPNDFASLILVLLATTATIALLGAALQLLLGRLAQLPHLLATLGVLLIIQDATPLIWGADPLPLSDRTNDFAPIAAGPLALAALLLLLNRTSWGTLLRATPLNDKRWLLASIAAGLAGLAGALTRSTANPGLDLAFLTDAIVVAVIGGLGSVTGAFIAAIIIGLLRAFLPEAAPYLGFALLAATLVIRPNGLLGRAQPDPPVPTILIRPAPLSARLLFAAALLGALAAPFLAEPATLPLLTKALVAILFAASLHVMMGPGGVPSLGHAAFFAIGAYAATLLARDASADMSLALLAAPLAAGIAALLVGALIARLPGLHVAMLTLAFAQLVWTIATQIGSVPIRPASWATPPILYCLTLALCIGMTLLLRRALYGRFGYALRATRDDPVRAAAIGLPIHRLRLSAFILGGTTAGLAGGLAAFSQGGASPTDVTIVKSAEALLMVLLGGIQTMSGPIVGALAATGLHDAALQATTAWRLILGFVLIAAVLLLPQGIAGRSIQGWRRAP